MNQELQREVDLWTDSCFENSQKGALEYLRHRMYVQREMKPLVPNGKCIRDRARLYWEYRNEIIELSPSELRMLAKLSGALPLL